MMVDRHFWRRNLLVMKFLHAADLHIDSPLTGLSKYEGAPMDEIRLASRRALENLVAFALEQSIDLVVLAGDIFDGGWKDISTGLFFARQMERLRANNIYVAMIRGNHDAASKMTSDLQLPGNVHVFASRKPETKLYAELDLAVHGQSFPKASVEDDLASKYPQPVAGVFNLGLLHTALSGREGHADYAPTTEAVLVDRGYDYWALGHVHQREVVCEDPWIIFPGNLQGRHIKETGAKGATLVTVEHGLVTNVEAIEFDVFRFAQLSVSIEGCDDLEALIDRIREQLRTAAEQAHPRSIGVRITITGAGILHDILHRDREARVAELRAATAWFADSNNGEVWLERVIFRTQRPPASIEALLDRNDAVGDIARAAIELTTDHDASAWMADVITATMKIVPADLRPKAQDDNALVAEAADLILSRLKGVEA